MGRLCPRLPRDPVQRGFVLLCITVGAVGFALNAQQTVVVNYFVEVLHFEGPELGYITAIREVPGFLLIFIVAVLYRLSLPRLTALALVLLAVGFALFGTATSFWTVAPWVVVTSLGYHVLLQTQHALAMTLTTESRSGTMMGRVQSAWWLGSLVAMVVVLAGFALGLFSFVPTFQLAAVFALIGAVAVYHFPHLRDGVVLHASPHREPIVFKREYGYFYALRFLDGARQQVFFSFGLWVLVHQYGMDVPAISGLLIASSALVMVITPRLGRVMDELGERTGLGAANIGYVVILAAYALIDNAAVACVCYVIYQLMTVPSEIGAAMYLRKVAVPAEIAPSLAMGLSISHLAAIVVPVAAGYILNYVGYQVPFLIACGVASLTFFVTRRLDATTQRSPRRLDTASMPGSD